MAQQPWYFEELATFLESSGQDAASSGLTLFALLCDQDAYRSPKGAPWISPAALAHEFLLVDRALFSAVEDPDHPVGRSLVDGRWTPTWKARSYSVGANAPDSPTYAFCISFAGDDRAVAEGIAANLTQNPEYRIFYDDFERSTLLGEDLYEYLWRIYSSDSLFCVVLFSHAYRSRVWTRHERRAAQSRMLRERGPYLLPIVLEPGALPDEFSGLGFWTFAPGDEAAVAAALQDKLGTYLQANWFTFDDLHEAISLDLAKSALLAGIRDGVASRLALRDDRGALILRLLAAVTAVDTDRLRPNCRALIDLWLHMHGEVNDAFGEAGRVQVIGDAYVARHVGADGPLVYSRTGWERYIDFQRANILRFDPHAFDEIKDDESAPE